VAESGEFLARWSRLKRKSQAEPREIGTRSGTARPMRDEAAPQSEPPEASASAAAVQSQIEKQAEALPSIETLGKDSDYTPFMRSNVPDALRNAALRKLWLSDPVFANLDGLVDYAEDYGAGFALGGTVATVYRILEGMPDPPEEKPPQPAESAPPTTPGPAGEAAADAPGTARTTANSRSRDRTRECELDEVIESDEHIDLD
jgi:hypothetical protein